MLISSKSVLPNIWIPLICKTCLGCHRVSEFAFLPRFCSLLHKLWSLTEWFEVLSMMILVIMREGSVLALVCDLWRNNLTTSLQSVNPPHTAHCVSLTKAKKLPSHGFSLGVVTIQDSKTGVLTSLVSIWISSSAKKGSCKWHPRTYIQEQFNVWKYPSWFLLQCYLNFLSEKAKAFVLRSYVTFNWGWL